MQFLRVRDILRKSRLVRYRFGFPIWNDLAVIDAVGQLPVVFCGGSKKLLKRLHRELPQLSNCGDTYSRKHLTGDSSHTPNAAHGQGIEELLDLPRIDDNKCIRLAQVAGDLGEEFVGSHADGRNQAKFTA